MDYGDIFDPVPSPERPTALIVTFRRARADRFYAQVLKLDGAYYLRSGEAAFGIRGDGARTRAEQNPDYFEAFDAWLLDQDPERPYADRLRAFLQLYESGALD